MSTTTFIKYEKNYLPGYTGHVPKKNEIYGCTAGDINNLLTGTKQKPSSHDVDITVCKPQFEQTDFHVNPPVQKKELDEKKYGNHSIHGENWIGGPTQNIKAQHVPGYAGYIPQIASENLYGKSFAKLTGTAINGEHEKGFNHSIKNTFTSENAAEFGKENFRNLKTELDPAEGKDINDCYNFHDAEFQGIEITEKRAYMDLPTTGYQGFQSKYRKPTTQINHRKDPFFNINPLRPKLNTNDEAAPQTDKQLENGGKSESVLKSGSYLQALGLPDKSEMKIPVVGYTGHRMGYRSQNFYGKNFKDCSIQSKVITKMMN